MMPHTKEVNITGVILAAGMGKRLGELTMNTPKALIDVGGHPLISYVVGFLRTVGCNSIVSVGGFLYKNFVQKMTEVYPDVHIFENPEHEKQNGLSFLVALRSVFGDMLVCDVDYIRSYRLAQIVSQSCQEITLYVCSEKAEDDDVMCVETNNNGTISDLKKGLVDCNTHSAGMVYVPENKRAQLLQIGEDLIKKNGAEKIRLEDILVFAIQSGMKIQYVDVKHHDWIEIDTTEELTRAGNFITNEGIIMPNNSIR